VVDIVALSVAGNAITGTIPIELENLTHLRLLYLDRTFLGPSLPVGICELGLVEFWADCDEIGGCVCCTTCCIDELVCV
jgi:hypothetical protein